MQPSKLPPERHESPPHAPHVNNQLQTQVDGTQEQPHYDDAAEPPEQHRLFNRQSTKVNSGLDFGAAQNDGDGDDNDVKSAFALNINMADLGDTLRSFVVPIQPPRKRTLTTEEIVARLLAPPPHAFVHGVLNLNWTISVAGIKHFKYRDDTERYVLKAESELRLHGKELGLPAVYYE